MVGGSVVLVVGDDEDCRAVSRAHLEGASFAVVEARDGREALDYLVGSSSPAPMCVLLDMEMPVMSGAELIGVLGSDLRLADIPIVVLSARPPMGGVEAGTPLRWLEKGCDWREILRVLEAYAPKDRPRPPATSGVVDRAPPSELATEDFDDGESDEPPPAETG